MKQAVHGTTNVPNDVARWADRPQGSAAELEPSARPQQRSHDEPRPMQATQGRSLAMPSGAPHADASRGPLTPNLSPSQSPQARDQRVHEPAPSAPTLRTRGGCKDDRLDALRDLLGQVPDADIAHRAGVSVRTVASFRAKHHIPGFHGVRRSPLPRGHDSSRLDRWQDIVGQVPDHVVAQRAGMSLGAVRNYRIKHGVEACGRMSSTEIDAALAAHAATKTRAPRRAAALKPSTPAHTAPKLHAWSVHLRGPSSERQFVVLATDIVEAGAHAQHYRQPAEQVVEIQCCGVVLPSPQG